MGSIEPWKLERLDIELRRHLHSCPCCQRNWECTDRDCGPNDYCAFCAPYYYGEPDMRLAEAREDSANEDDT